MNAPEPIPAERPANRLAARDYGRTITIKSRGIVLFLRMFRTFANICEREVVPGAEPQASDNALKCLWSYLSLGPKYQQKYQHEKSSHGRSDDPIKSVKPYSKSSGSTSRAKFTLRISARPRSTIP
jgi:hypothetical protein